MRPPLFNAAFREKLVQLFAWRRDVRRFLEDPIPEPLIDALFDGAQLSPSVGNAQPWRWMRIESPELREKLLKNFEDNKAQGAKLYVGKQAALYDKLKLSGFDKAPLQLAVFCDRDTRQGYGLGKQTMPETLEYSVVAMITSFWLLARSYGLGVGWVSVINPDYISRILEAPPDWRLVAILCVGWPEEELLEPELESVGWQPRTGLGRTVIVR
jgi:5,6-dimethylbenzimidazole synthase